MSLYQPPSLTLASCQFRIKSLVRTQLSPTSFHTLLITMASQISRSSSITRTICYISNTDTYLQGETFVNKTTKTKKTSRWNRHLFKRINKLSFTRSYHQFDELIDSEYPFLLIETHDRSVTESSYISASDWSLASTISQSSNDSTISQHHSPIQLKKTILQKRNIVRQQKKASTKFVPHSSF
jgi:hypothetical protein